MDGCFLSHVTVHKSLGGHVRKYEIESQSMNVVSIEIQANTGVQAPGSLFQFTVNKLQSPWVYI